MTLAELTPDMALAALLDGRIMAQTTETDGYAMRCYPQAEMPGKGLDNEFLTVQNNGVIRSLSRPVGIYRGNLALTVYCKANADGTAKHNRIRRIVAQCEEAVNGATSEGFWYGIDATNVIVPITVDSTTGYGMTTINVVWHTL